MLIFPIRSHVFRSFEGLRNLFLYNIPQLPRRIICAYLSSRKYRDLASWLSSKQFYLTHYSPISAPLVFSPLQGWFCLETLWSLDNFKKLIGKLNNALSKRIVSGISGDTYGKITTWRHWALELHIHFASVSFAIIYFIKDHRRMYILHIPFHSPNPWSSL